VTSGETTLQHPLVDPIDIGAAVVTGGISAAAKSGVSIGLGAIFRTAVTEGEEQLESKLVGEALASAESAVVDVDESEVDALAADVSTTSNAAAGRSATALGADSTSAATTNATVEGSGGATEFVEDLSHVTGRTTQVRNAWIEETKARVLRNVRFTFQPKYNPFITKGYGVAKPFTGTQIGPKAFATEKELVDTLVHEELHHRWFARGVFNHHATPTLNVLHERIVARFMRMKGY
jgi:hypothetical protein